MNTTQDFLGVGWGVPLLPENGGALAYVAGPEKVRQSIFLILDTEPGERIMRPDFGCGLRRYLMRPNTSATRALIQREVATALQAWEPRIEVRSIQVTPGDVPSLILVEVLYVHKRDGQPGNLVYPFYLE
jgi:phage baseplate assembly protein W